MAKIVVKRRKLKKGVKKVLLATLVFLVATVGMAFVIKTASDNMEDMYERCDKQLGHTCSYYEAFRLENPTE